MAITDSLKSLFDRASSLSGVSASYYNRLAGIESSYNPNAQNPNSSAGGLFQFIDSTWSNVGSGSKFGTGNNVADAIASFTKDNFSGLSRALGRSPTQGELYLAHQQGLGGATKLLSNPSALATSVVGYDAVINNGGNPGMTAGQFASLWTGKFDDSPAASGLGASSGSGFMNFAAGNTYTDPNTGETYGEGNGWFSWIGDYFVRGTIIVLGFIFVAVGLAMFKPALVVNALPAGRVANAVKGAAALAK